MIPINELQVGNWVEFLGQCQQIDMIDIKKGKITFKGCTGFTHYSNISAIEIGSKYESRIIDALIALPTGADAIEYKHTNDIKYLHELQNKCKDATNIKL